jgi:hydrogenase maturation protease
MSRVLVGGIGNVFFGDDAFGVEVVRALASRPCPEGVRIVDFGVRGFDLARALVDGYDLAILVDATRRGGPPGTLYLLEPEVALGAVAPDGHSLEPARVLALARTMAERVTPVRIVGCEPESLGVDDDEGKDGTMALSAPVAAAVPHAVAMIERLVKEALDA